MSCQVYHLPSVEEPGLAGHRCQESTIWSQIASRTPFTLMLSLSASRHGELELLSMSKRNAVNVTEQEHPASELGM